MRGPCVFFCLFLIMSLFLTCRDADAARNDAGQVTTPVFGLSDNPGDGRKARERDDATLDDAQFQKVKDEALPGQTIMLPSRPTVLDIRHAWPSSSPDRINFWLLWNARARDGGIPLSWGYDPIFRTLDNSFMLNRGKNIPGRNGYLLRLDDYFSVGTPPGETRKNITGTLAPHCIETARTLNDGIWCVEEEMTSRSRHGENVTNAVLALRPADALNDGLGPRGEIWGRLTQTNDATGLNAALSGSMVGHELDLSASGKADQEGCSNCAGRNMVQFVASTYSTAGKNNEITNGLIFSSHADRSYFSRVVNIATFIKDAGIDLSRSRSWSLRQEITADTPTGSTTLRVRDTDAGVFVGQAVSGPGIAAGTRVTAITSTTMALSSPTVAAIARGQAVTCSSDGDALRLAMGQTIAFDAGRNIRMREAPDGQNLVISHQGKDRFSLGTDGTIRMEAANPSGATLRMSGTGASGLDTTALSSGSPSSPPTAALKMAAGQCVAWEAAMTVRTCFADGGVTFYWKDTPILKVGRDMIQMAVSLQTQGSFSTGRYTLATLPADGQPDGARAYCTDCKFANGTVGVPVIWHAHGSKWTDEVGTQLAR